MFDADPFVSQIAIAMQLEKEANDQFDLFDVFVQIGRTKKCSKDMTICTETRISLTDECPKMIYVFEFLN
jgi:hypothetical protein